MVKFIDFSRPSIDFQVLYKANLLFKDCPVPVYSSTFQACTNPVKLSAVCKCLCQVQTSSVNPNQTAPLI